MRFRLPPTPSVYVFLGVNSKKLFLEGMLNMLFAYLFLCPVLPSGASILCSFTRIRKNPQSFVVNCNETFISQQRHLFISMSKLQVNSFGTNCKLVKLFLCLNWHPLCC